MALAHNGQINQWNSKEGLLRHEKKTASEIYGEGMYFIIYDARTIGFLYAIMKLNIYFVSNTIFIELKI